MSIRINQGAGGAYDPTEEGKRALKIIIPVIIIMFFAWVPLMSAVFESDSSITFLAQFVPILVIGGSIYYLY